MVFPLSSLSKLYYLCGMLAQAHFLFIGGTEIGFILFIILLVFGADKIPEIARGLGKTMKQIKHATNDIKSEITKSAEKQGFDLDITKDVRKEIDKVKEEVEDITGVVKRKF
ncbi:MAG: sec-independent protein translocase protein TatA [Planctomycetota bacterium]|jgi:sec-independent protein translocase protein TatA